MARMVQCVVLKREAAGLVRPPYPGEIGERIYAQVSQEGWARWLERLTMILNENQLSTADPRSVELIEQHMMGYLFGESELGGVPDGFQAAGSKK
ncbi:MAG: oxidative damage protection protein [Pseudomonadota bacterium]|nr:oxidative damage protection protein [Pseudomonadota bacterium]